MQVGDIVRITQGAAFGPDSHRSVAWPEAEFELGVVVAEAKRLHIPAAKVLVLGQIVEFDLDELEVVKHANVSNS